jgi:hypothetical protein
MAATLPFEPNIVTAVVGKTVAIATGATNTSVSGTVDSTGGFAPSILVTNQGPNLAWVRMSAETTPTATGTDTPMLGNSVKLFGNPVPTGKLGVAVIVSVTTSANTVFFTIGQGGLVP